MDTERRDVIRCTPKRITLEFPYSPALQTRLKQSLGARWDAKSKRWWIPLSGPRSAGRTAGVLRELGFRGIEQIPVSEPAAPETADQISSDVFADLARKAGHAPSSVKLRPYQVKGAQMLASSRRALLADQPGLGKTYQSLAAVASNNAWPLLIVCPAAVRTNWLRETLTVLPWLDVNLLDSAPEGSVEGDVVIVSWEGASRYKDAFPDFRAIIADEAHYAKDSRSQRTKALTKLAADLPEDGMFAALTGTPVVNCHDDLAPVLEMIDALCLFGGRRGFRDRYCGARTVRVPTRQKDFDGRPKWREVQKWDQSKNGGELRRRLVEAEVMLRRRKADVLDDLPPKNIGVQVLDLDAEWQTLLDSARSAAESVTADALRAAECDHGHYEGSIFADSDDYGSDIDDETSEALVAAAADITLPKPRQVLKRALREMPNDIARITLLRKMTAVAKIPLAAEWVNAWLTASGDEKIVVFARHREATTMLGEHLRTVPLIGGVSHKRRQEVIDAFTSDPDKRVLVASYEALGTGVNLQAASNVLFLEQPWTPAGCEQAEDRCHRIGQRNPVTVTYLVAAGTIDEPVWAAIDRKQGIVDAVTDGHTQQQRSQDSAVEAVALWAAGADAESARKLRLAA